MDNMAPSTHTLPFLYFLFISLVTISSFVHSLHHQEKLMQHLINNSSAQLSLPLYPYSSVISLENVDYTFGLVQRVNSINAKLQQALSKQTGVAGIGPNNLQTPVTSIGGVVHIARIGVGHPAKEFYMAVDTGSDLTWLQCNPCDKCFKQADPIFDPSKSSTFSPLPCNSAQCAAFRIKKCYFDACSYGLQYADESYSFGELATETLTFGKSGAARGVAIGCGLYNGGNIGSLRLPAGLLGLGGGPLSLPSQLKASSFSYCMVDAASKAFSTLEFNPPHPKDSIIVPMLRDPKVAGSYYVGLTGIRVGGALLPIPASAFQIDKDGKGGVILDSGTVATLLPEAACKALKAELSKHTRGIPREADGGGPLFDMCYKITSGKMFAKFPGVGLVFTDNKTLWLPPKNYLKPFDSKGKFCVLFAKSWISVSIIGVVAQKGFRVTYDLARKQIGFSPNKC